MDISSSQKYQGPGKNKGVHCWSLLEKSGSWNYPGPGKNQGLHCWTLLEISRSWKIPGGYPWSPLKFSRGYFFLFFDRRLIGQFGLITGGENLFEWDFVIRFWKIGNQCIEKCLRRPNFDLCKDIHTGKSWKFGKFLIKDWVKARFTWLPHRTFTNH